MWNKTLKNFKIISKFFRFTCNYSFIQSRSQTDLSCIQSDANTKVSDNFSSCSFHLVANVLLRNRLQRWQTSFAALYAPFNSVTAAASLPGDRPASTCWCGSTPNTRRLWPRGVQSRRRITPCGACLGAASLFWLMAERVCWIHAASFALCTRHSWLVETSLEITLPTAISELSRHETTKICNGYWHFVLARFLITIASALQALIAVVH